MRYASIGMEFTLTVLGLAAVGYWLDAWTDTAPGFLLMGGGVGFALAFWRVISVSVRVRRQNQPPGDDGPDAGQSPPP